MHRAGRGLVLTEAGESLLAYARRLVELNDEAVLALQGAELSGWVRLGLQEDFGESLLAAVLGGFAQAHPRVRVEARVARNAELQARVVAGQLDLALAWGEPVACRGVRLAELPMRWIGPAGGGAKMRPGGGEPVPLLAFEAPCLFRTAATGALDRAGIPWRLAFTSASLAGLWAAAAAGLGLTVRTALGVPSGLRPLSPGEGGLPELPSLSLSLLQAEAALSPPAARLAEIMKQALAGAAFRSPAPPRKTSRSSRMVT